MLTIPVADFSIDRRGPGDSLRYWISQYRGRFEGSAPDFLILPERVAAAICVDGAPGGCLPRSGRIFGVNFIVCGYDYVFLGVREHMEALARVLTPLVRATISGMGFEFNAHEMRLTEQFTFNDFDTVDAQPKQKSKPKRRVLVS